MVTLATAWRANQSGVGEINLEGGRPPREKAIKIIQEQILVAWMAVTVGIATSKIFRRRFSWGRGGGGVQSVEVTTTETVVDMTDSLREWNKISSTQRC